jgi:hypothetical protein
MNTAVKFGIYTGISVAVWTIIMGLTGWFKDPILLNLFWMVVIFQFVLLYIGLKKSSIEARVNGEFGKSYTELIKNGLLITIIAGVLIFFSSLLFTTQIYPEYFNELRETYQQILTSSGKSEIEIEKLLEENSKTQTPFLQALFGFIGTFLTGLLGSSIFSAIFRKRE